MKIVFIFVSHLGKALEERQEFAQSFQYYQQGNHLKAQNSQYNSDRISRELNYQQQNFDAEFFNQRSEYGHNSSEPIFIVGLPLSLIHI